MNSKNIQIAVKEGEVWYATNLFFKKPHRRTVCGVCYLSYISATYKYKITNEYLLKIIICRPIYTKTSHT